MTSITSRFYTIISRCTNIVPSQYPQIRASSFKSSPFLSDIGNVTTKYEVTKNPEDWKFVQRILPPTTIPNPVPKENYSSSWKPQSENLKDMPYYIPRSKNHMVPVYMKTSQRGLKRLTYVRRVQGDIWLLEKELRDFLQGQTIKPIRSQVNELVGYICFHGDHVNAIKDFLLKKDF